MTPWVDICTLTQPKGVKGRLGVIMAPGFFTLKPRMEVYCVPPLLDKPRKHVIVDAGLGSDGQWWVELSGVSTRDGASALSGSHCLVRREAVADSTDWSGDDGDGRDWTGWTIVDELTGFRGTVASMRPRPLQPLLVARDDEGREVMVPLADELIVDCDDATTTLTVRLPSGLWQL